VFQNIISIRDLSNEDILKVLDVAKDMEKNPRLLEGKQIALLFFEPSTRTRLSFECAVQKLGGRVLDLKPNMSSLIKGESFSDTIRVIAGYCDAMVIRHPKDGAARLAAELVDIPIINGGDGSNQHPTQTLLDLYTIMRKKKTLSGLKVSLVGDLKYGRTVHSLSYALDRFGSKIRLVSPEILDLPEHIKKDLSSCERIDLDQAIQDSDILYVTRIQKERFSDPEEYEKVKKSYRLTAKLLEKAPKDLIVMHPLPIVNEIAYDVDNFHGVYFEQSAGGVPVRMALLAMVTGAIK
jgi:aspartate carbamoyltransferase catalytic subunit